MMLKIAKETVTEILKTEAGVKQIYYDENAFGRAKANPSAIILAGKEKLREMRRKSAKFTDENGTTILRSQVYERTLPVEVNIFHRTEEQVDEVICSLLGGLPKGIDDGKGNWTPIEPAGIEWPPDQKERSLAVVFLNFVGGIYRDKKLDTTYSSIKVNARK